jgi:hypothetical protein
VARTALHTPQPGRRWRAALIVLVALGCSGGEPGESPAEAGPSSTAASDAGAAANDGGPSYPASAEGLVALTEDLARARRGKDAARAYTLTRSLRLEDPKAWFREQFGDTLGAAVAADYDPQHADIERLVDHILELREDGRATASVEKFDAPGDPKAIGYQRAALAKMKRRVPLYSLRLSPSKKKSGFHLWSFVHLGGSFRYVGKMKPVAEAKTVRGPEGNIDVLEFREADAARLRAAAAGSSTDAGAGAAP